jgi:hypothetical protein
MYGVFMKGFEVIYKPKDKYAGTLLHFTIFGRLSYRNRRGRRYANYTKGFLHNLKYVKLIRGKIFIKDSEQLNLDELREQLPIFGEFSIKEVDRNDILEENLYTGREYWKRIANEKGYAFRSRTQNVKRNERKRA